MASLKSTTRQQRKRRSKLQVQVYQSFSSLCKFVLKLLQASGTTQEMNLEVRCES